MRLYCNVYSKKTKQMPNILELSIIYVTTTYMCYLCIRDTVQSRHSKQLYTKGNVDY